LDLTDLILDQNGDEHKEAKDVTPTNALFKLESLTIDIPNQFARFT
jgi:hypothetical protein